jgi:hypothetical protein
MYRFHLCNTDLRFPDLQDWRIEIQPNDLDTLMKIHRGVAAVYLSRGGDDWLMLSAQWFQSAVLYLWKGPIVVNSCGGLLPLEDVVVLDTVDSEELDFHVRYDDEIITISRWPQGHHYYLASNKLRIFDPVKYISFAGAYQAALRFVSKDRIK